MISDNAVHETGRLVFTCQAGYCFKIVIIGPNGGLRIYSWTKPTVSYGVKVNFSV
jgi:hypothetical protein